MTGSWRSGLVAVLDLPHPHHLEPLALTTALLDGGATMIQLRAKGTSSEVRRAILASMGPLCDVAGVPLIVNDDHTVLDGSGVKGVHLGQGDLPALGSDPAGLIRQLRMCGRIVGISTHSLDQVAAAVALGADYVGFGPVFPTRSKLDSEPVVGLASLADACRRSRVPVIAIGGIGLGEVEAVVRAGAWGIAVIGALTAPTVEGTRERCRALVARMTATSMS